MFKKSSLGSAKSFPGGRRDAGAFQELRQLTAEDKNEPHVVDKQVEPVKPVVEYSAPCPKADVNGIECTCPPEPEHDHDVAAAEGEGMPPFKNNCKLCYPPSTGKILIVN